MNTKNPRVERNSLHFPLDRYYRRKVMKCVLAVICACALILTCCEYQDGSIGLWNFIWLAVFALSGKALDRLITKYPNI